MNRTVRLLIAALVCVMLATWTHAQRDGGVSVSVSFGYGDTIVAERWCPVRVQITSETRTIAGVLSLSHKQDGSQDVNVSVPVSVLPGQTVTSEVILNLPHSLPGISVELRDMTTGRIIVSDFLHFQRSDSRRIPFRMPTIASDRVVILALGLDQMAEIARDWNRLWMPGETDYYTTTTLKPESRTVEQQYKLHVLPQDQAPASWAAYDGIKAVIASASSLSALSERSRRALLDWVHGGGELVLVVDDASNVWRSWLPAGPIGDVIDVLELRTHPAPSNFSEIRAHASSSRNYSVEASEPASQLRARSISIRPSGAAIGWKALYALDDDANVALVASGPAGFGRATIIGFDPAAAVAIRSRSGSSAAWAALLARSLKPQADVSSNVWAYYSPGSGGTRLEVDAIASTVDGLIAVRGIGGRIIAALIVILGLVVVGIGPVDALVLRKFRARHWSWATACGWITLTSLLAIAVPIVGRDGSSQAGRATIADAILDERGEAVLSWTTGVTVSYASESGPIGPADDRPGAWWRGVSPLESWGMGNDGTKLALRPVQLQQFAQSGPGGAVLGTHARTPTQRVWTVRALLDVAPASPRVTARASRDDGAIAVEIRSLDASAELLEVVVVHKGERRRTTDATFGVPLTFASMTPVAGIVVSDADEAFLSVPWTHVRRDSELSAVVSADLPGASRRTEIVMQYGTSSSYAVVIVTYRPASSEIAMIGATEFEGHAVTRLVVPVRDMNTGNNP